MKLFGVVLIPGLLALAPQAHARDPREAQQQSCVFGRNAPRTVVAYVAPQDFGGGAELAAYSPLAGAQLYVPAQEGMTAEWLTLQLQRALARNTDDRNSCGPHVGEVRVSAVASGPGYWVTLVAADPRQAASLLDWARGLLEAR
jgi:hypothetical protein